MGTCSFTQGRGSQQPVMSRAHSRQWGHYYLSGHGRCQVSLLVPALQTHRMTYNNLPVYLLGYVLVWVLNFPTPRVRVHAELRPKSILRSSWIQHKHSACFHRGFIAPTEMQPNSLALDRQRCLSFIRESLEKTKSLWKPESKITLHITHF